MRFRTRKILATATLLAGLMAGNAARAARIPRIELLREISVAGTRVLLSDLLPAGVPEHLRTTATEISLGSAPQPGSQRILEREALEHRIFARPGLQNQIAVPDRVVISRDVRQVSLSEVYQAIRAALESNGIAAARLPRQQDVSFGSKVLVSPGNPGLQVIRADIDSGLHRARFLLWPSNDPKVLPFVVTARIEGEDPYLSLSTPGTGKSYRPELKESSTAAVPVITPKKETLVFPGQRATLAFRSSGLRIFAEVMPLERGTLGQRIRVRMIDTGKILSALVDGEGHLEAQL